MNPQLIAFLISVLTFTAYVVVISIKYGILRSISISYYYLKKRWIFTIIFWIYALSMMVAGSNPWIFGAGAFICFVGAAANIKDGDITRKVHIVGATGGIILGTLWLFISNYWYLGLIVMLSAWWLIGEQKKNHTFWIEIISYYVIALGILINIL